MKRGENSFPPSKSPVPLSQIAAVMCNYVRPNNARTCVRQLQKLGIEEIIVWNNKAEPIPEATHNINYPVNIGPLGKYLAGLGTKKNYILVVDDDFLILEPGLTALRRWVRRYPLVGQNGAVFYPPFDHYGKKFHYRSDWIKTPHRVDMVQPNMGMMLKTELYRRISLHWAWKSRSLFRRLPGLFSTDLEANCAAWELSGEYPVVVPANGPGFCRLPDEAPEKALSAQEGIKEAKTKVMQWLLARGWRPLRSGKVHLDKNRGTGYY